MLLLFLACSGQADTAVPAADGTADTLGIARREDGWLRGDLHMHTTWSDGYDDVATVIALAESLDQEPFVSAHPEYAGNGVDFLAITDHRTVAQQSDPAYASDRLVLLGGEEFGGNSHAGVHGVHEFVDHDPDGDGTTIEDLVAAIERTHELGGAFSPNHPMIENIPFPWRVEGFDAVEAWNSGWGLMSPALGPDELAEWEAAHGEADPAFRRAVAEARANASDQALAWAEALLTAGRHPGFIGGSDRHAVLLPAFPTTWVRAEAADEASIVAGIRARHTFVSRSPVGPQVLVEVEAASGVYEGGDDVPVAAGGERVRVRVRVGRADGGRLRLVAGSAVADESELAEAALGAVAGEWTVEGDDFTAEIELDAAPGDWFYPVVHEPLIAPGLDAELEAAVREFAAAVAGTGANDFAGLAGLAASWVDGEALFDASKCDPEEWRADRLQCMPADDEGIGSFFVPDFLDRALNVVVEDGEPTDWSMGAVGSPVRFVEATR